MPRPPEVATLIEEAKRQCHGCRIAWRLDGWKHRKPKPIICTAQPIRQELRNIAAQLPWRVKQQMQSQHVVVWSDRVIGPFTSRTSAYRHVRSQFDSAKAMRQDLSWSIKPLQPPE